MKRQMTTSLILAAVLLLGCDPGDGLTEDGYEVESFTYNGTSCKKQCDQLCTPQKNKDKECCKTLCEEPAASGCKTDCDKKCLDQYPGKDKQAAAKNCCKSSCPPPPPGKCKVDCDKKCLAAGKQPGDKDLKEKCCKKICKTEPPPQKEVCDKQCVAYLTKLGFGNKVINDKCCKKPQPQCDPKTDPNKCQKPQPQCDPKTDPNKCQKPQPKCDPIKDPKCQPAMDCDAKCIKKLESEGHDKQTIKTKCCTKAPGKK